MNNSIKFFKSIFLSLIIPFSLFAMEDRIATAQINEELMDKKGHFKDGEALKAFLSNAACEGQIPENFMIIEDAHELVEEHKISQYWTEQLFWVKCENGEEYIIKEISQKVGPKHEISKLMSAASNQKLENYVYPISTDGLQFIFPTSYLCFSYKGQQRFLSILPKAKGKSIIQIMRRFKKIDFKTKKKQDKIVKSICIAHFDLGRAMAKLYNNLGTLDRTNLHGDLQGGNVFHDAESRLISLIDNDRVNQYLQSPRDISWDLGILFAISPYIVNQAFAGFLQAIDLDRWYTIAITSFIFGFLSKYEESERKGVFMKLKDLLLKCETYYHRDHITETRQAITKVLAKNSENENNLESQYIDQGKNELEIITQNPDLDVLTYLIFGESSF